MVLYNYLQGFYKLQYRYQKKIRSDHSINLNKDRVIFHHINISEHALPIRAMAFFPTDNSGNVIRPFFCAVSAKLLDKFIQEKICIYTSASCRYNSPATSGLHKYPQL